MSQPQPSSPPTQQPKKSQSAITIQPLRIQLQSYQTKLLGIPRFINIRDIMFMTANRDKQFLRQSKQYIDGVNTKVYMSASIFPISMILNFILQKKFPDVIGGVKLRGAIFDLIWYSGVTYLFVLLTQLNAKQKQFQQIKSNLIQKQNNSYLLHLYQNMTVNKISLENQLQTTNKQYSKVQLINLQEKVKRVGREYTEKQKQKTKEKISQKIV